MGRKNVIVIPARMDSVRLPGKPLADVNGKPLLRWTYDAAKKTKADYVIAASPDEEIEAYCAVESIPFQFTDEAISNGTLRCKQAMERAFGSEGIQPFWRIVNWQVDEPLVDPTYIDRMFDPCGAQIQTLVSANVETQGPSSVKVLVNDKWTSCHWFTRQHIPGAVYHCGVYSFDWITLMEICQFPSTTKSKLESLEQLTWLENGYDIVPIKMHTLPFSINIQEDLEVLRMLTK